MLQPALAPTQTLTVTPTRFDYSLLPAYLCGIGIPGSRSAMDGINLLLKDWHHQPKNVSRANRMWWEMDHMMFGPDGALPTRGSCGQLLV